MQLRKITLFTLFATILLICSLSTISAADQTINSTSIGGISQGIADTGVGETLFLQPGTYNKAGQDTNINVNKNITIQGNGSTNSVIIDAQKLSRIFMISSNLNVTFMNITFINGNASGTTIAGYGGAIYSNNNNSLMTIINCIFTNNTATGSGGAIYHGSTATVSAINLTILNSEFTNNVAANGGGLTCSGPLILENSLFNSNKAIESGGAIRGQLDSAYSGERFSIINNCLFINNSCVNGASNIGRNGGGALSLSSVNLTITNSNFTNNKADNTTAGAFMIYGSGNFTLDRCIFENNSAYTHGGAIFNGDRATLTIKNTILTNNSANGIGGAVYNIAANMGIYNSNFTDNSADNGGAIYNTATGVNISSSNFINNKAITNGGVIFNRGDMSISTNTMSGNSAGLGQMIYNNGSMGVLNLTFIDNSTWIVKNGSTITLYATLTDDMGNTVTWQNILFYLNGVFFEDVTSIEGKANITYTPSSTGDIPISGEYAGIGAFNILINNGLLKVRIPTKITIGVPKEVKVGDTVTLISKLTDENGNPLAGKTVDFYVDGKKVGSGVTDSNGIAKLNYTFTKAGKPNVEAKFVGDDTYLASNATNSTTVSKIPTNTTVKTDKDTITVTLTDENGNLLANKKVTITINGKTYTKTTNSQGQIVMKYKNAWDYKVTANFAGDEKYLASKATAPKRTPTKTTIKTKGDKVTATLTDENGKPLANKKLTFRVKGVIIGVGITDANGQVVIYYKKADKKAVTVSFEGDSEYMPSNATSTPAKSDNVQTSGKVAMKNTGIPIIAILLALIASFGLVTLKKRE